MWRICAASAGRSTAGGSAAPARAPSRARPAPSDAELHQPGAARPRSAPCSRACRRARSRSAAGRRRRATAACAQSRPARRRRRQAGSRSTTGPRLQPTRGTAPREAARTDRDADPSTTSISARHPCLRCHGRAERTGVAQRAEAAATCQRSPRRRKEPQRPARLERRYAVKPALIDGGDDPAALRQGSRQTRGTFRAGLHGSERRRGRKARSPRRRLPAHRAAPSPSRCPAVHGADARGHSDQLDAYPTRERKVSDPIAMPGARARGVRNESEHRSPIHCDREDTA